MKSRQMKRNDRKPLRQVSCRGRRFCGRVRSTIGREFQASRPEPFHLSRSASRCLPASSGSYRNLRLWSERERRDLRIWIANKNHEGFPSRIHTWTDELEVVDTALLHLETRVEVEIASQIVDAVSLVDRWQQFAVFIDHRMLAVNPL